METLYKSFYCGVSAHRYTFIDVEHLSVCISIPHKIITTSVKTFVRFSAYHLNIKLDKKGSTRWPDTGIQKLNNRVSCVLPDRVIDDKNKDE